jgi:dUTPase
MYALGPGNCFEVWYVDGIAQLVIGKLASLPIRKAKELSPTQRGPQGHGSKDVA